MPTLYAYIKHQTPYTDICMLLPDSQGADDALHCTELATVDGITYVCVPDGVQLPDQPQEIDPQPARLTPELLAAIKAASPHVQLINERVLMRVRSRYTAEQELKLLRQDAGPERDAYVEWAEACAAWGREQKAALGLVDFDAERTRALREVDRIHQQIMLNMTGNPTEVERTSWPVKLDAARLILQNEPLPEATDAMLTAMGLTTSRQRSEWAGRVQSNSARYQTLIGIADRVRSIAAGRIRSAKPETWADVGRQNRADLAAALAEAAEIR